MNEMTEQNLKVIENDSQETREEVVEQRQSAHQTNPIARKLLDFSIANKTDRFSVKDLFKR
ncbi:hypothetical protein IJ541_01080 [bacterium]|nr:hypothetical protein [bacterium]